VVLHRGSSGAGGRESAARFARPVRHDRGAARRRGCGVHRGPFLKMALIVQKYGGTSVGDLDRIRNVARRALTARKAGNDVVVVVSAMAGETNRLLRLTSEMAKLPSQREQDVVVSTGEQVSVGLLALAIQEAKGKARSFLGHQVRILTDSAFSNA